MIHLLLLSARGTLTSDVLAIFSFLTCTSPTHPFHTPPQPAPTYMVVSPQNCFELCAAYYRPMGIDYFFFQIYYNGVCVLGGGFH